MNPELGIVEIVHLFEMLFPSIAEYAKIIIPSFVFGITLIGVFSNILPDPDQVYPVPNQEDIKTELKSTGKIIYFLTTISRRITLIVNRVICSRPYRWFYKTTDFCSRVISHLKGSRKKYKFTEITKPKPYVIDINRYLKEKEQPDHLDNKHDT